MKEIFSKLNFMETPAESGERMSRFEQERYFEDFASQIKHTAAPQTPIRMTARKVLATAACAAIVLGVTGGAGYGIWQLYRNTPTAPLTVGSAPEAPSEASPKSEMLTAAAYDFNIELVNYQLDVLGFGSAELKITKKDSSEFTAAEIAAIEESDISDSNSLNFQAVTDDNNLTVTCMMQFHVPPTIGTLTMNIPTESGTEQYHLGNLIPNEEDVYVWGEHSVMMTNNGFLMKKDSAAAQYLEALVRANEPNINIAIQSADGSDHSLNLVSFGGAIWNSTSGDSYVEARFATSDEVKMPFFDYLLHISAERIVFGSDIYSLADAARTISSEQQSTEQAETLRLVSYQRDENGFLRMQLEADPEMDETLLVQALLANGTALQYSWGTSGQEGMNCIELATRIPTDVSELELHHNNAPLTFDVSEITHKGLAVCDNGNVMISSLGVSFTNDSSLLPWLKENLLTVGIDKRSRTPMGEVEYREKDPTVLPQVIRRALFMNEYSAPMEVNGTWIDGYIFFQMYEGEKVISPEIQFDKLSYITIGNLRVQSSGEPVRDFCYDTEEDFQPSATESTGIVIYKETLSATTTVTATE